MVFAKMNSSADADILPEDAVFEILLWLPVISLLRFKSVCKSWYALIQSSNFVHQHLHHCHVVKDNNCNLVVLSTVDSPCCFKLSLLSGERFEVSTNSDLPGLGFPKVNLYHLNMVACNGVICVHNHVTEYKLRKCTMNVSLWNPATKQFWDLPKTPFSPPQPFDFIHVCLGIGYDFITNDYKVVRFFNLYDHPHASQVEIYSLNTNSWRAIDTDLPLDFIDSDPKAPYRNGTYCWLGRQGPPIFLENGNVIYNHLILSFDFGNEVFGTMALPDVDSFKFNCRPILAILRDNIACINKATRSSGERGTLQCEIWVLKEYGVRESWVKLYNIGPFLRARPFRLSENGDTLLLTMDFQLCSYDLATQEVKNLPVQGSRSRGCSNNFFRVVMYKESLVSIKREYNAANSVACVV